MIDPNTIVVVSGLPRSGTSMVMQMLEAGGLKALTDHIRAADEDNLKGYYELEKVKTLKEDSAWLRDARGKAVKIISHLLRYLPGDHTYKILFLKRDLQEVLASQARMLARRGVCPSAQVGDEKMAQIFRKHLQEVENWLSRQPNMQTLYVNHGDVLKDPSGQAERINRFLDNMLDTERMAAVIDSALYRQRR